MSAISRGLPTRSTSPTSEAGPNEGVSRFLSRFRIVFFSWSKWATARRNTRPSDPARSTMHQSANRGTGSRGDARQQARRIDDARQEGRRVHEELRSLVGPLAFGDVANDAGEEPFALQHEFAHSQVDGKVRAVFALGDHFAADADLGISVQT